MVLREGFSLCIARDKSTFITKVNAPKGATTDWGAKPKAAKSKIAPMTCRRSPVIHIGSLTYDSCSGSSSGILSGVCVNNGGV